MSIVVVVLAVVAAGAVVVARTRWWPYGPCPRCRGRRGRGTGSTGGAYRKCGACKGSGERIRPMSRLLWARWREEARRR